MEKTYKHIKVVFLEKKAKTKVYRVVNKKSGSAIGVIEWYVPWRQYCFMPVGNTVFSSDCLSDIIDFIALVKAELNRA